MPNPCAKHLRLVYGWSSLDLLSRFALTINDFDTRTYRRPARPSNPKVAGSIPAGRANYVVACQPFASARLLLGGIEGRMESGSSCRWKPGSSILPTDARPSIAPGIGHNHYPTGNWLTASRRTGSTLV